MREIEDHLRELGGRVQTREPDARLGTTTLQRIRKRRQVNSLTAGLLASFAGVVTIAGIVNLPPPPSGGSPANPSSAQPVVEETPPARFHRVALEGFGAVWPEDTADETSEACSSPQAFRSDPVDTALEFGRVVLGWDAEATASNRRADSVEVELTAKSPGGVLLTLVEYVEGCWSVQSVLQTGEHTNWVVDRDVEDDGTSLVSIDFDPPEGSSGTIELGFGPFLETKSWVAAAGVKEPVTFRLQPVGRRDGGHFLILFEDEQGNVLSARGDALPSAQLRD